jgi:DNA-binding response OmpR family regulator
MATILLIEDAQQLAQVLVRELAAEGYRTVHAADGLAGLALYAREPPDLVVLDWMLPQLDGLEVLRRMRLIAPTPVLMLTARDAEADRVAGLDAGADDYLTKPFGMPEFLARVRALLRRVEQLRRQMLADRSGSGMATSGLLRIDSDAHRATLDGEPLDLSPTEFALLFLLVSNPGRAFSRAYLLETIWGGASVEGDRAVDNAIMRLRKKLGLQSDAIETVWGVGYRLRETP